MDEKIPQALLDEITPKLSEAEAGKRALEIIRLASHKVLDRLKQAVIADVSESTKQTVTQLTAQLGDKLLKTAEGWNAEMQDDLLIYPEGTRFVRRRVATQILVLEQKPQTRTLAFHRNLEDGTYSGIGVEHYAVALPYTIFTLHFRNGAFQALYVGWRTQPLTSIDDPLFRPGLPNIGPDLAVCMGHEFKNIEWSGERMAERVNKVIGIFWQSTFNKDINDGFVALRRQYNQFESLKAWAKNSKVDPLFILNLSYNKVMTLRKQIEKLGATTPNITQQLQKEVLQVVNTVSTKLTKALEGVEIGSVRPGELTKQFTVVLQDILKEAYADCWKYADKKLNESEKRSQANLDDVVREQLEQMLFFASHLKKKSKWE